MTLTLVQATVAMRKHLTIENKLHWQLDVTLVEDAHRSHEVKAVENLVLVRGPLPLFAVTRCAPVSKTNASELEGTMPTYSSCWTIFASISTSAV